MISYIWNFLIGLVSEDRETLSLARVAFWIAFYIACGTWLSGPTVDIPWYQFGFLAALLIYNLSKKAFDLVIPGVAAFMSRGKVIIDPDTLEKAGEAPKENGNNTIIKKKKEPKEEPETS